MADVLSLWDRGQLPAKILRNHRTIREIHGVMYVKCSKKRVVKIAHETDGNWVWFEESDGNGRKKASLWKGGTEAAEAGAKAVKVGCCCMRGCTGPRKKRSEICQ